MLPKEKLIEAKEYREKAFIFSPMGQSVYAIVIAENMFGLNANRPKDRKQIVRILINSIKNN